MEVTAAGKAKAVLRCSTHSCVSSEEMVFEFGCEGWVRAFTRETKRRNHDKSMG